MKVNEVLDLDCRSEENMWKLQSALKKIKPLSKYDGKVPIESIEKLVVKVQNKYNVTARYLFVDMSASQNTMVYSCNVMDSKSKELLKTVYGASIYEVMAKLSIAMFIAAKKDSKR